MDSDFVGKSTEHFFGVGQRTTEASEQEIKNTLDQLPLLKKRLEYLDKKVAHYSSIDSVIVDLGTDPAGHRNQIAVNKLMKSELESERKELEALIKSAAKRR